MFNACSMEHSESCVWEPAVYTSLKFSREVQAGLRNLAWLEYARQSHEMNLPGGNVLGEEIKRAQDQILGNTDV